MRDYTELFPGKTEQDAASAYRNLLHDRFSHVKKGEYGCMRSERHDGCKDCNLRRLLGRPVNGGGCCGWTLQAMDVEEAIRVLEVALDVDIENGKTEVEE